MIEPNLTETTQAKCQNLPARLCAIATRKINPLGRPNKQTWVAGMGCHSSVGFCNSRMEFPTELLARQTKQPILARFILPFGVR